MVMVAMQSQGVGGGPAGVTAVTAIGVVSVVGGRIMVVSGARDQIMAGMMAENRIRSVIG